MFSSSFIMSILVPPPCLSQRLGCLPLHLGSASPSAASSPGRPGPVRSPWTPAVAQVEPEPLGSPTGLGRCAQSSDLKGEATACFRKGKRGKQVLNRHERNARSFCLSSANSVDWQFKLEATLGSLQGKKPSKVNSSN